MKQKYNCNDKAACLYYNDVTILCSRLIALELSSSRGDIGGWIVIVGSVLFACIPVCK
jgi:hypothetical protein